MNRSSVVSSNDAAFLLASLRGLDNGAGSRIKLRLDGRTPLDMRSLAIRLGNELSANVPTQTSVPLYRQRGGVSDGMCELSLGQTRAIACVTGDIVKPHSHRPTEGFLSFHCTISPMAAPNIEPGRPSDRAVEIGRIIERSVRDSRAIDTEALCIISGERVWSIRCDVTIIDDNGNVSDCAMLAALIALIEYRRPDVTVIGNSVTVHNIDDRQPVPLSLHHWPIPLTFAFYANNDADTTAHASSSDSQSGSGGDTELMVVDPSLIEEQVSDSLMTVTVNQHSQICSIHKRGGVPINQSLLLQCLSIAQSKSQALIAFVQETIQARDRKRRLARGERLPTLALGSKDAGLVTESRAETVEASEQSVALPPDIEASFGSTVTQTDKPVDVKREINQRIETVVALREVSTTEETKRSARQNVWLDDSESKSEPIVIDDDDDDSDAMMAVNKPQASIARAAVASAIPVAVARSAPSKGRNR